MATAAIVKAIAAITERDHCVRHWPGNPVALHGQRRHESPGQPRRENHRDRRRISQPRVKRVTQKSLIGG